MKLRISVLVVIAASVALLLPLTYYATASAASWGTWHTNCAKWILDIPKVDSQIQTDLSKTNYEFLTIDFAELAVDGRHIGACTDATLNSLDHRYGAALYATGLSCSQWASSGGRGSLSTCFAGIKREKSLETQVLNRISTIEG
jgi:hypothetical protein